MARIESIKADDLFGEYVPALAAYLDYEHVQPYLNPGVSPDQLKLDGLPRGDSSLQEAIQHYREWWAQKGQDGRGISVWRGRTQMTNRLFLAGIAEWTALDEMEDGGWYQERAYNFVADLFGWGHVQGPRYIAGADDGWEAWKSTGEMGWEERAWSQR